jgi:VWFA-related protein
MISGGAAYGRGKHSGFVDSPVQFRLRPRIISAAAIPKPGGMMSPSRLALLLALLPIAAPRLPPEPSATAPTLSASQSPDNSTAPLDSSLPVPTIHITSRAVVLDVVVTDGQGKPVHGLKPSDFTVLEDGVPQKLASFTEHDTSESAAATGPLPPNTFAVQPPPSEDQTRTVIVLADLTSWSRTAEAPQFPSGSVANTGYVRNDIAAFLNTAPSTQPVAIVRLDWQGMHLVQGLTADRNILTEAIASKRMEPPLGFVVRFARAAASPARQLVRYVNSIPGRINLVWITYGGGLPGNPINDFPDLADVVHDLNGPSEALHLSRVAFYPIPLNQQGIGLGLGQMVAAAGGHLYLTGIRQALNEIAATGSDYYTVSYVPTNPNWNGAFRKIKLNITGFPQPQPSPTWSEAWSQFLGWTEEQKSKILYRSGYYARSSPDSSSSTAPALPGKAPTPASARRTISSSPKSDPNGSGAARAGTSPIEKAVAFGTLTPDQIHFTIVTTPSPQTEKVKLGSPLPNENSLAPTFRTDDYRNVRVHFRIQPQTLKFARDGDGSYEDDLQFVVVIYRDDGIPANSIATTENIQLSAEGMEGALTSGISYDQTIAVPVSGNPVPGSFFLRVVVSEKSTGNIGAIEIPAEWVKLPPTRTASSK